MNPLILVNVHRSWHCGSTDPGPRTGGSRPYQTGIQRSGESDTWKKSLCRAILPNWQPPATGRLVKYVGVAAMASADVPRATDRDRRRDETSRQAASAASSGAVSGIEQILGRVASRSSFPGRKLVFQQRAATSRARMASFSHELLNSSHDPVCKTGRDRVLNLWNPAFHTNYPTTAAAS